jgi:DNA repair protein RecO (recombination protein O)
MTHVRASYSERPKQELVRLDAFEILSSPLTRPVDYARTAALELVAEVLEELPEGGVDDAVFRLAVAVTAEMQVGRVDVPVTYFCLWMSRLMGWMPELGRCSVCGTDLRGPDLRGARVWYSATSDGVTCEDDRRGGSVGLSAEAVAEAGKMFRGTVGALTAEAVDANAGARGTELRRFAVEMLERGLERRLMSARALGRS